MIAHRRSQQAQRLPTYVIMISKVAVCLQDAGVQFICRGCDAPGYEPFLFNKTYGIQLYIKTTSSQYTTGMLDNFPMLDSPDRTLSLVMKLSIL